MNRPQVRVILDEGDGRGGNTWITVVPVPSYVPGQRHYGVARAAGEALAMFVQNITSDAEAVNERLAATERSWRGGKQP